MPQYLNSFRKLTSKCRFSSIFCFIVTFHKQLVSGQDATSIFGPRLSRRLKIKIIMIIFHYDWEFFAISELSYAHLSCCQMRMKDSVQELNTIFFYTLKTKNILCIFFKVRQFILASKCTFQFSFKFTHSLLKYNRMYIVPKIRMNSEVVESCEENLLLSQLTSYPYHIDAIYLYIEFLFLKKINEMILVECR